MPVELIPDPEGLRDRPDGDIVDAKARAEARRCATIRADWMLGAQGAQLRAEVFSAELIAGMSVGVVGLMLEMILNGSVPIRDAKQAIEISNIALKISEKLTGVDTAPGADNTAATRAQKVAQSNELMALLRERARTEMDETAAAAGHDGYDPDEWESGEEDDPRATLRAV